MTDERGPAGAQALDSSEEPKPAENAGRTSAHATAPPDEPKAGGKSGGSQRWRPSDTVIRAGQVAGGITALLTLGLLVWTQFIDTGGAPMSPPHAKITEARAYPDVTLRSYLSGRSHAVERWISHAQKAGFTRSETDATLATRGVEAQFAVSLAGTPGMTVTVTRSLFDARTHARIPEEGVTLAAPAPYVTRDKPAQFTEETWVAAPTKPGRYFVELELLLPDGEALATKRTESVELSP
jgi:hypothetical protein